MIYCINIILLILSNSIQVVDVFFSYICDPELCPELQEEYKVLDSLSFTIYDNNFYDILNNHLDKELSAENWQKMITSGVRKVISKTKL